MTITLHRARWEDRGPVLAAHIAQLRVPYDDFLEDHILGSQAFDLRLDGEASGTVAAQGSLLTFCALSEAAQAARTRVLAALKAELAVTEAFVATTDQGFLSTVLPDAAAIKVQALHWGLSGLPVRAAEFPTGLRRGTPADAARLRSLGGDFLDDYEAGVAKGLVWPFEVAGELVGFGVRVANRIWPRCIGTGMFVSPAWRGRGVGRSILLALRDSLLEEGATTVPGCWVHNHDSRRTLASAGYTVRSQLLRIALTES